MTTARPSHRQVFAAIALGTAAAMAFALYLQYIVGLVVCPLCVTQRIFIIATGVISLTAALHNPARIGQVIYALLALIMAGIGAGFAGRHVWLQHLPPDEVPACGPSLEYMLETLPFAETFKILIMGDGNCAEVVWTFLGFSIPELTLGVFTALILALLSVLFRPA